MSNVKLCMSCMNAVPPDASRCPHCGYNGKQQNEIGSLPIGYRLAGRYVVGMCTGNDADSVSYAGYDTTLNKKVEVREFFLKENCTRDDENYALVADEGAELFYKTALMDFCELYKNLRKIEGQEGLIRVPDFVEANNTAYAILDLFDGITLREFLSLAGGSISAEQAVKLLTPVIHAVEAIHAVNLIHRGISPETIFVNRNGDVKLGGFATSQTRTKGTEVDAKLYSGYAAPEQYATTSWQSTATDVYALAAVFYRCVSGQTPQDAEHRRGFDTVEPLARLKEDISPKLSRAVAVSMLINADQRTQSAAELLLLLEDAIQNPVEDTATRVMATDEIKAAQTDIGEQQPGVIDFDAEIDREEAEEQKRLQRTRVIITIAVGVVAVVLIMVFLVWPLLGLSTRPDTDDPGEGDTNAAVEVPNYLNQRYSEIVPDDNFKIEYNYIYDADLPEDTVVSQTPAAGSKVEKGTTIILTVNRGERVEMPNLVGMTVGQATAELQRLGITYTTVEEETPNYAEGVVIAQSVKEGTEINPNTRRVTLTVAKAPPVVEPPDTGTGEETTEPETGG